MTNSHQQQLLQSAPLLMPAVALSAGIVAGQHVDLSACWLLFFIFLILALALYRRPYSQSVLILLTVAALGATRSAMVQQQHAQVEWPEASVSYEAVIASEMTEKPKTMSADIIIAGSGKKLKGYIEKDDHSRRLAVGDRLQITSRIGRNNTWQHGAFNYQRYLEIHGFSGQTFVRAANWQQLEPSWEGLSLWQRVRLRFLCYRHHLLERYQAMGIDRESYAVLAAMTLGDKSAMTTELKDVYAVSGASHVLALSGLHLGIIYLLLSMMIVRRRLRIILQPLAVVAIWAFTLLVGLPSSVVRAAVMISIFALLSLTGRNRMSLNALALAAILILVVNPDSLFDVGFQLSFAAMLAILTLQPMFEQLVSRKWLMSHPLLRWLWGLATVSVAAQVGTAPLVAYYFGRFSTYFLLTNFIVIPTTTVILYMALAALLLPMTAVALLTVVSWLNKALALTATRLPCPSIEGLHPSVLQTTLCYVIILSTYLMVKIYDKQL